MSNLVTTLPVSYDYRGRLSNYNSRQGNAVDRIVVHHFSGHLTPDTLLKVFKNRNGSSTYAIFRDGSIGYYIDEAYRPWTSSSWEIDRRAITIEVENEKLAPEWTISAASMDTLIKLLADLCRRYPLIGRLRYDGTKAGSNLHKHRWYADTDCPGPYLEGKWQQIVKETNRLLGSKNGLVEENGSIRYYRDDIIQSAMGEYFIRDAAAGDRKGWWIWVERDGTVAQSKFVYVPDKDKWVYYDNHCHMVYGPAIIDGKLYYFDETTGAAASGETEVATKVYFDPLTKTAINIYRKG